jgi:predicted alpha/beta superfamily hydrolase
LNGWTPGATPAERLADGRHWLAVEALPPGSSPRGAKYKWHAGDQYVAPPEATAYGFDGFGEHGFVAPPEAAPWTERFPDFPSSHLALPRALRARLPAGFVPRSAAAARARVLLLHDGQNVFDPTAPNGGWRAGEALDAPAFRDVVALAVDNAADRFAAYTHVADDAAGMVSVGGRADAYWALLDEEALPFLGARYGVPVRGARLAVGGSSLGGLVSLYGAMRDDDRQACVIAMSPTVGWGSFAAGARGRTLIERWPGERGHGRTALYLDSGGTATGCVDADGDGVQDDGSGGDNSCETAQLRDVLAGLGYAFGVDLAHWLERGARHDEAAWAARLPRALGACAAMGWSAAP